MPLKKDRYKGPLYRALNPVYARNPLSGRGAQLYGGRFNPKGRPTLYTSLDPSTALREANQVGSLQPTVLVSYRADLGPVFDTRDANALESYDVSAEVLSNSGWRAAMLNGQTVPTQDFAENLIDEGYCGLLVRSFASGTTPTNLNVILWRWTGQTCTLEVVDDEDRLRRL